MLMSRHTTPYSIYLGDRDPFEAISESIDAVKILTSGWLADQFERSYGEGKWTARQVLIHLAQTELAIGTRARMAALTPHYTAQVWDQNEWIDLDARMEGPAAVNAFAALAGMNLTFFQGLSAEQRARTFSYPEYGELSLEWVIHQIAGHQNNHLRHLQQSARPD